MTRDTHKVTHEISHVADGSWDSPKEDFFALRKKVLWEESRVKSESLLPPETVCYELRHIGVEL